NTPTANLQVLPASLSIQHKDILPLTLPKLNHIPAPNLHIPSPFHRTPINARPSLTLQINNIRLHPALPLPVLIPLLNMPKLNRSMLPTGTRVLRGEVHDADLPPHKPATPRAKRHRIQNVLALEDEELPIVAGGREPRLGGLVVLQRDAGAVC